MNKNQNDYDERLKYRVGRAKLLITVISILITVLAYIILGAIPKSDGEDPIYTIEMFLYWIPIIVIILLGAEGEVDNNHKTPRQWSSFMIAQYLKEKDRKKELKENTIETEQRIKKSKDDNKDDGWSDF